MGFDSDARLFGQAKLNHERFPALSTGPVSSEPYISEEYLNRERMEIFR